MHRHGNGLSLCLQDFSGARSVSVRGRATLKLLAHKPTVRMETQSVEVPQRHSAPRRHMLLLHWVTSQIGSVAGTGKRFMESDQIRLIPSANTSSTIILLVPVINIDPFT